jgi:hypothetical protein
MPNFLLPHKSLVPSFHNFLEISVHLSEIIHSFLQVFQSVFAEYRARCSQCTSGNAQT